MRYKMQIFPIFGFFFLIFDAKFIIAATMLSQLGTKCKSACTTSECKKEAEFYGKYMDPTVDPCNDFYQFVCGNYLKNVPIPEDRGGVTHFHSIGDKIRDQLKKRLKTGVQPSDLEAIKNVKIHYQNCLDETAIENVGTAPLVQLLKELGGWPVLLGDTWKEEDYKWEDSMSSISKQGFIPDFPVKLSVTYDPTNSSNYILQVKPAVTTVDESFFVPDSKSLEAYETLLIEVAVLLGATREKATTELKKCTQFEVELHKIKLTSAASTDLSSVKNRIILDTLSDEQLDMPWLYFSSVKNRKTLDTLSDEQLDMPWLYMFNEILYPSNMNIDKNELLYITDPQFVSKIGELIGKTSKRVLANYQIWRVIFHLLDYLPRSFRKHKFNFYKATLGLQKEPERDNACYDLLQMTFQTAIGVIYVKNFFDKKSKERANEILGYVTKELESTLHQVPWMDEKTRSNALEKLQAMKSAVGYPDEIADNQKIESFYKDLKIHSGNFFEGYRQLANHTKNVNLNILKKSTDETQWTFETNVAYANAFYDAGKNKIRITAGILQEPFFKFKRPRSLNYGGIGYIMGHEMTHAFDSTGRKYDKHGNHNDWWDENTANEFENRVKCLVDQYNDYVVTQINQKMDGNRTKGENIADVGGIKLAYRAFVNNKGKTEQCLPNLDYSSQQLFWINAASTWCTKVTDEIMRIIIREVHSPPEARVNIAFSNIPEFSDDFKCPLGSKMNPINKCTVW